MTRSSRAATRNSRATGSRILRSRTRSGEGDQEGQQQPVPAGISPQEQEQMLDAIQAQEDRTQDKLKEKQGVVVRGTKNW